MTAEGSISWSSIVDFLNSRRNLLDAVAFSGGEPMLQPALLELGVKNFVVQYFRMQGVLPQDYGCRFAQFRHVIGPVVSG